MRVDVVITNYNGAPYVAGAVRSALAQTHRGISVIVVDDGSSDGSLEVLAQFSGQLRLLALPENRGLPAARNAGIAASSSPLVALLDSDDVWLGDKLERQVREFERIPRLGLCFTGSVDCDVNLAPLETRTPRARSDEDIFDELYLDAFPMPPSTVLLRREAIVDAGLFDESMRKAQDIECWLRIALKHTVSCVPDPLVLRRRHPASISAVAAPEAVMNYDRRVFELCGEAAGRAGRPLPMPVEQRIALGLSRRAAEAFEAGQFDDASRYVSAWRRHPRRRGGQAARLLLAALRGVPHWVVSKASRPRGSGR
ncbi:MAG: glycosyltransferase [Acidobacteria bacterium]|nr:glycosyltransferase [Acidobacteriota bacterium]